jgi:UDP-N-acetylglucosamine transferase subunit ALG13
MALNVTSIALITVGTTKFPPLTTCAVSAEFASALVSHWGIQRILLQYGETECPFPADGVWERHGVTYDVFRFKPNLWEYVLQNEAALAYASSDISEIPSRVDCTHLSLIVSHAGAGSIFEACRLPLSSRVPLVVVVNAALSDNHQVELADAMEEGGYAKACFPETLVATLCHVDALREVKPLPAPRIPAFTAAVSSLMGW